MNDAIMDDILAECTAEVRATFDEGRRCDASILGKYLLDYKARAVAELTNQATDAAVRDLVCLLMDSDIDVDMAAVARLLGNK